MIAIRPARIEGDVAFIPLTRGNEAVIDAADVALTAGYRWFSHAGRHTVYASRNEKVGERRSMVLLHRVILSAPAGMLVDHIDGDGLNNRRSNLRLATAAENCRNQRLHKDSSSGLKGVSWHESANKWVAQIWANGKNNYLGVFSCPERAHAAYLEAAKKFHGNFAAHLGASKNIGGANL